GATMSAVEALREARAADVGIEIDGADLILRASDPPPATVIEALSRHKAEIIALLRAATSNEPLLKIDTARQPDRIMAPKEAIGLSWAEWKAVELNRLFQEQ